MTRFPPPWSSSSGKELWQQGVENEASIRQISGRYTPMVLHPGDLAMIITPERAPLKAQERFDHLLNLVQPAGHDGQRIDIVERDLMRQLLALGHDLLTAFVAHQGDGTGDRRSRPPTARSYVGCPSGMTAATCRASAR